MRGEAIVEDSAMLQRAALDAAARDGFTDAKAVYAAGGAATFAAHDF